MTTLKKTPAQLLRRIAMLEAQNLELQKKLAKVHGGWGELCMEKIVFEHRCINAIKLLSGED